MKWLRRSIAVAIATACAGVLSGVSASAQPSYQLTPHDGTIYQVSGSTAQALSFDQWTSVGRPNPVLAPVKYVGYYWGKGVYVQTPWSSPAPSTTLLSFDQWTAAARPSSNHVAWIPGTYVYQWATSDQVGVVDPAGSYHWLTKAEWQAMGSPAPHHRANEGFAKLSWSSEIARMTNASAGQGYPISYATWAADNAPTPMQVTRFAGDQFYRNAGSSTVYYAGPTMNRAITAAEWHAAGAPAPEVRGSVASGVPASTWAALAKCESGGNPRIVSSNGKYHGLYQFTVSTWRSVGGSGLPSQASPEEQTERAAILQARSGWGQWPHCSRVIGVR